MQIYDLKTEEFADFKQAVTDEQWQFYKNVKAVQAVFRKFSKYLGWHENTRDVITNGIKKKGKK